MVNPFLELVNTAPKKMVSSNNIRNCFEGRRIDCGVYQKLESSILREGFWSSCAGAVLIKDPNDFMYDAVGGNHRAVISRGPKCGMEAYILDWGAVAEISIKKGLIKEGPFSLTKEVKEALIHAVERTESGQHGRSLVDECAYFNQLVRDHFPGPDFREISNERVRLTFKVPKFYEKAFGVDMADGRAWGLPKAVKAKYEAAVSEAKAKGLPEPVYPKDKRMSSFYSGYGPDPSKQMHQCHILAKMWNQNFEIEAARLILKGLKFFWTHRDIMRTLPDYYLQEKETPVLATLRAIGKMTEERADEWADITRAIPREERATSDRFKHIKPPAVKKPADTGIADAPNNPNRERYAHVLTAAGGGAQKQEKVAAACEVVFAEITGKLDLALQTIETYKEVRKDMTMEIEALKERIDEMEEGT